MELDDLAVAVSGLGAAGPAPSDDRDADLAARVRAWFAEAWTHPLWTTYRRLAKEDMGYYVGGEGQWSVDGSAQDLQRLRAANRAHVTLNHIQPIVDVLTGFERQNRFDLKASPQGTEDAGKAELLTWILKHEQERTDAHAVCSQVFEDGIIQGMSAVDVAVDWTRDPLNGEIDLEVLQPGEDVIWDPHWQRFDLSDARYVLRFKRGFVDDIVAQYPEHEAAIRDAIGALSLAAPEGGRLHERDPRDGYGGVRDHRDYEIASMLYEARTNQVLVIEAWYTEYDDRWLVADRQAGTITEAANGASARATAAADPARLTAVRRQRRVVRMAVVLPATYQVLERDAEPYPNDNDAYPIVVYVAKRKHDDIYGIVRNLKDAQRIENKRESHAQDIVARLANLRPVVESAALENPAALRDPWSSEPIYLRPGRQPPGFLTPPVGELVRVLLALADRGRLAVREVSGINTDLLGLKSDDASGIAIARRQAQGQVISTVYFDNYRRFRRLLGKRLSRRIQQVYTGQRTLRLVSPEADEITLLVNPVDETAVRGQNYRVLRDLAALDYDIVISEAPSTPSMRATSLLALLEILRVVPALAPALLDVIVELAEIPDRRRILDRVRRLMGGEPGGALPPEGPPVELGPAEASAPGRPPLQPSQGQIGLPATARGAATPSA
jgi:hypothetical protein